MENERKRILQLVENGTLSAEEAIVLLEALSKPKESTQTDIETYTTKYENSNTTNEEKSSRASGFEDIFGKAFKDDNRKMDEFMNDIKQDLSQFSSRLMGLMNTTLTKIKDFDLEFPFGEKVEFNKTFVYDAAEVKGVELEIPNGKVEVVKAEDDKILIEATVKSSLIDRDEEKTKAQFEQQFAQLLDGKLTISAENKMSQVSVRLVVPEKQYEIFILRLLNGGVTIDQLDTKLLKVKTYNGAIKVDHTKFHHADVQSGNGAIELVRIQGEDLEAETVNGRIYIDGDLQDVEAESVNGAVIVTTHDKNARKIKAQTVAGAVEIYIPKAVSINGQVSTNFGKADVGLTDVVTRSEEDQFLLKTLHFDKIIDDSPILKLTGESRTGSIIVRYTNM